MIQLALIFIATWRKLIKEKYEKKINKKSTLSKKAPAAK